MFSFLNPWFIIGAICAVLGVYFYGHHAGYQERVAEDQAEIIRLNDQARAKEADLNGRLAKATTQLRQAKDAIQSKQTLLNSRIDAGELRLPSSCPVQASTDAATAGGNPTHESDAERQAIKDIVSIAAEGDAAITQLNACINTYNQVRETVNVKP
jgi:hypothetical protein